MSDITITLINPQTGQSESLPLSSSVTINEVVELGAAILGLAGSALVLVKDGKPLLPATTSLSQAGVVNGDLLAVMPARRTASEAAAPAPAAASHSQPAGVASNGFLGLDFSNLLGGDSTSSAAGRAATSSLPTTDRSATPVYYQGMTIADAVEANPHPDSIVRLLQTRSHLFKELNYHNPVLARKLENQPYERAVQIWREDMVRGSIGSAAAITQSFHREREFTERLRRDPNDKAAKEYFEEKERKSLVNEQYRQAMQEYPESMGRVLMLYIEAKINGNPLQAFVDSGAQMTIMSKRCADRCGILHLVDTRFAGVAVGVGTGKILGRIHIVQLQIGDCYFPCSVTIMDDATLPTGGGHGGEDDGSAKPKDMDFLLGLDCLKRFKCMIDLGEGKLKFRLGDSIMETPFLHEKDLDESKGGTKGFCANRANQELMEAQRKYEEENSKKGGDGMEE
jgi:Aspartyl protease